jgi:hypothetical protein
VKVNQSDMDLITLHHRERLGSVSRLGNAKTSSK